MTAYLTASTKILQILLSKAINWFGLEMNIKKNKISDKYDK